MTGTWAFGGQWEWGCLSEYVMVIRKSGACMRLSGMDTRKLKGTLGALSVRVQARNRWHTHLGYFEENLTLGLFTKVWIGFRESHKELWSSPGITTAPVTKSGIEGITGEKIIESQRG